MIQADNLYKIGSINKAHGLKGEVTFTFTDDIFDTTGSDHLIIEVEGIFVPFFIEEYRFRTDSSALMKFEGIDSADDARQIVGCDVFFEKSKAAGRGEAEMSLNYFVGFRIEDGNGQTLGTVTDIDDQTENWLFIVTRPDGQEILIPAHEEFITDIHHEDHILTMQLPEGLLDI